MMQAPFSTQPELKLAHSLVKQGKYLDAYDRFQNTLLTTPRLFTDIMILLYRELAKNIDNVKLKLIISELYLHQHKYEIAFDELIEMIEIDPYYTQTYFLLSKYYKKFKKKKDIQYLFEKAFENNITDSAIIETLSYLYFKQENIQKGIPFFEKLCNLTKKIQHTKALAHFYCLDNNFDKATTTFEKILDKSPEDIPNLMIDCEALIKRCPNNQRLHELLISLYTKSCLPEKAVTLLQDMESINLINLSNLVKHYKNLRSLFPENSIIMIAYVECLIKNDHITEAVDLLKSLFEIHKKQDQHMIHLLQDILIKFPENHPCLLLLLDIQMTKKQYKKALSTLEKVIENPQESIEKLEKHLTHILLAKPELAPQCHLVLGKILACKKRIINALNELEKCHNTPEDLNSRITAIQICLEHDQIKDTKAHLQVTLKKYPYNHRVHHLAQKVFQTTLRKKQSDTLPPIENGILHLYEGSVETAIGLFQSIPETDRSFSDAQLLIARCFMQLNRYDLAIHRLKSYTDTSEQSSKNKLKNNLNYLLSINYACSGYYDKALSYLDKILAFDIHFPYIKEQIEYLKKRKQSLVKGTFITACSMPNSTATLIATTPQYSTQSLNDTTPSFANDQHEIGTQALLKNDLEVAEKAFNLAIEIDSNFHESYLNLALISCLKNEYKQAWKLLTKVEEQHPDLNILAYTKGFYFFRQSLFNEALKYYKKALELFPEDSLSMLSIGDCYFQQENLSMAFRYWEKALKKGHHFHLIHQRWYYLNPKPTAFNSWTQDFSLSFNPLSIPKTTQLPLSLSDTGPLFNA